MATTSYKWNSYESLMKVFEDKDDDGFVVTFSTPIDESLAPVLFWKPSDQPYGFLGNWYPSEIVVEGVKYTCTEQYIMAQKALLFNDQETYSKIMSTNDPYTQKKLGRVVSPFDLSVWVRYSKGILFKCCLAKFTQHKHLGAMLLETGLAPIAEASPLDAIYGIGLSEDAADAKDPRKWKHHGESKYIFSSGMFVNFYYYYFVLLVDNLGECLMEVRSYLRKGHWNDDGTFVKG